MFRGIFATSGFHKVTCLSWQLVARNALDLFVTVLLQLRFATANVGKDMFEEVKKKDKNNRKQKDGHCDGCVGGEVDVVHAHVGEHHGAHAHAGHHGERLHPHSWQEHQRQVVAGEHEGEGGHKEQLHSWNKSGIELLWTDLFFEEEGKKGK